MDEVGAVITAKALTIRASSFCSRFPKQSCVHHRVGTFDVECLEPCRPSVDESDRRSSDVEGLRQSVDYRFVGLTVDRRRIDPHDQDRRIVISPTTPDNCPRCAGLHPDPDPHPSEDVR
jgi:hypothetical protein